MPSKRQRQAQPSTPSTDAGTSLAVIESRTPVADDVIEDIVTEIRVLQHEATLGFAVRVGELIINRMYGGDFAAWRSHGPKEASFRKLTDRLADRLSASVLYRSVALYDLAQRLGGVSTWKHLGVSHARAVLGLPAADQERLLSAAEAEAWTVDRMEQEVSAVRQRLETGLKRGRRPLPTFVKSLHSLRRFAEQDDLLLTDLESAGDLEAEQLENLTHTVTALQGQLSQVLKRLRDASRKRK